MTLDVAFNLSAPNATLNSSTNMPARSEPQARIPIPRHPEDITTDWLNAALAPHLSGHRIARSWSKAFSEPGQTADVADISLRYDSDECTLPRRMIAKLAAIDPDTREMCKTFKHYERETDFYRSFPSEGLPIVQCFHADYDAETMDMVILMEHLAPSQAPSYGITVDQVRRAISEAAVLHARWWNDEYLKRQSALIKLDDREHWSNAADGANAACAAVQELLGDTCKSSVKAMEILGEKLDRIMAYAHSRPFALQHCDFHAKQMFFPHNGEGQFAIIDWQFSVAGPGAWDIARIINLGLDSDARMQCEEDLIKDYLGQLAANGVADYDRDEFMIDYKYGILFSQLINFIAINQTDRTLLERECAEYGLDWKDVWLARGERMMREYNVPAFLQSI